MRKRIIDTGRSASTEGNTNWLPLERIALVEVTSEDSSHPIDGAMRTGSETGWRAALPGEQTIRLVFDQPQQLRRIQLVFVESEIERSQEFVLRWSSDSGQTFHEIVRQQWNFSPESAAEEREDYHVELSGVTQLELTLVPDRSGGDARASLLRLRIA